jgi:hypothetical protein
MKRTLVLLLLVALILGVLAPVASACDIGFDCENGTKAELKRRVDGVTGPYQWDPVHPSGRWLFLLIGLLFALPVPR